MAEGGSDRLATIKSLALILPAHLAVTAVTWQDLKHRDPGQIRGGKRLWRVLSGANTLGSVLYFTVGRKRQAPRA